MAKCEFNKDATPQRDCLLSSYFEGTLLSECFHLLFLVNKILFLMNEVVHCLSVSLTNDTLSMDS